MKAGQIVPSTPIIPSFQSDDAEGGLDVKQFLATLRRRSMVIVGVTIAVMGAAWLKALTDEPVYTAGFEVLVQPMSAETEVISSVPETLTNEQQQPVKQVVTPDLVKILSSSRILQPALDDLEAQFPELTYSAVLRNLTIGALGKDSSILQVSYTSANPSEVQAVLEQLSQAYLDYSLQSRQADISRGREFVEKKLPDLQDRVEELQGKLQGLRQNNNLIDPDARGQQLSSQVTSISQQQLEVKTQLDQIRATYGDLRSQLSRPIEAAASAALSQNPRYQMLLNKLLELDAQIGEASTLFLETTPDMQVLMEQRQNLLNLLEREAQQSEREVISQMRLLEAREQSLRRSLNSLNAGVNELSGVSRQYTDIQRELQIATENLRQFLAKREALQIEAAQREIPWELLTPPNTPQPSAASASRNLALGTVLGLLLGVGAALALERLTNIIHTAEEIRRITKLPLLGVIPLKEADNTDAIQGVSADERQAVGSLAGSANSDHAQRNGKVPALPGNLRPYKAAPFRESFRSLYTNIRLLNSDAPIQSVVISSSMPGEGKSTTAAYLAQAAAAMGRRVLLMDADLRNPSLHEQLDLPNDRGLSHVLAGEAELKDVLQRSPKEPRLFVLTAGEIPPDATRFLSSVKMQQLIERMHERFDFIIYDTPPLLGIADAYLVAAHTDGLILVSEPGRLKRSQLEQVLEQLRLSSTPTLGIVLRKLSTT